MDKDELLILLVKKLDGTASQEELIIINQALEKDSEAQELWEDVLETFDTPESRKYFLKRNEEKELRKIHATISNSNTRNRLRWIAAAVFIGVVILGASLYLLTRIPEKQPPVAVELKLADGQTVNLEDSRVFTTRAQYRIEGSTLVFNATGENTSNEFNTLIVPRGRMYNVMLPDSTLVHLNAVSTLRFPSSYTSESRELYIEGEGYFEVRPDANRAFIVHTRSADISVLGTDFNVNTYSDECVVSLLNGSVMLSSNDHSNKLLLRPGLTASLDKSSGKFYTEPLDSVVLDWVNGRYHFNARLDQICVAASRWYNFVYEFDDPQVAKEKFTGMIDKSHPLQSLLNNIKSTNLITYYITSDSIVHFSYPKENK